MRTIALLALVACFDPLYDDQTRCGPAGECPPGRTCMTGFCRAGGGGIDAGPNRADAGLPDAASGMLTLTITKAGNAAVAATFTYIASSSPTLCDVDCPGVTLQLRAGTAVMITAVAPFGAYFQGFGAPCVGPQRLCNFTMTGPVTLAPAFATIDHNLVFVTSPTYDFPGDGSGLAGADALCADRAFGAGLSGTYHAVMSGDTTGAIFRLQKDGKSARGFVRLDGLPIADSAGDLLNLHRVWYPVKFDELGNVGLTYAWSGSNGDGTAAGSGNDCTDWNSTAGFGVEMHPSGNLDPVFGELCSMARTVICAMVDESAAVEPPAVSAGKLLFQSTANWTPSSGLTSARGICASEAPLGHTAVPLLATETSAASLLSGGQLYVRGDGLALGTGAEIMTGNLRTGPWIHGDGSPAGGQPVWTGSDDIMDAAVDQTSCDAWSNSGTTGVVGSETASVEWWVAGNDTCLTPHEIYCVEP